MVIISLSRQRGLVTIAALMVLIALTLIVLSGSRNSTMQLRMASNLQLRVEALEQAQAGLDFAANIKSTDIPVGSNVICSTWNPEANNCSFRVDMPAPLNDETDGTSWLTIERDTGLEGSLPRNLATSEGLITFAYFKAVSTYDNTAAGQGRARVGGGLAKIRLNDTSN